MYRRESAPENTESEHRHVLLGNDHLVMGPITAIRITLPLCVFACLVSFRNDEPQPHGLDTDEISLARDASLQSGRYIGVEKYFQLRHVASSAG
jgi:hypothetical protein